MLFMDNLVREQITLDQGEQERRGLKPFLTPVGAWAFSLGTAIGWGSLVVTSNTYLLQAGPLGSVIGLAVGALIMLVVARNYHYLINCFPDSGGAYAYTREVFGYDHGFLTAWFLGLTYLAILWANATSVPIFARYFLGDMFRVGPHYSVFGYEVFLGEALLTIGVIVLAALVCMLSRKGVMHAMVVMALVFIVGITVCFAAASFGFVSSQGSMSPDFLSDSSAISQVLLIACISPWAFIGFENVSQLSEEYTFPRRKVFRIIATALLTAMILYAFVILMSVMAYPPEYASWFDYISDLGNLEGIKALPPFYAAEHYLGSFGVNLLMLGLLALVATSLFGNTVALSRLLFALGRDGVVSESMGEVSERNIPVRAVATVAAVSLVIPFLGRIAVGWIVDVTIIGATVIYGFVSAAALEMGRKRGDELERMTGGAGLVLMVLVGIYLLAPSLFLAGSLEPESYFLFTLWGILGLVAFRILLSRDGARRFGRAIVVWIGMLSLVAVFSYAWMSQSLFDAEEEAKEMMHEYYQVENPHEEGVEEDAFVREMFNALENRASGIVLVGMGVFALSLVLLLVNISHMSRRAKLNEEELDLARGLALTDPLTGVKSKRAYQLMEKSVDEQIANGTVQDFAIAVCDINDLKVVNDDHGHNAGDALIRAASKIICDLFRHSPVFRIGGDEFAVVLTGADFEVRHELMEGLGSTAERNVREGGPVVAGGLSQYNPAGDTCVHEVFERADASMYINKRSLKGDSALR